MKVRSLALLFPIICLPVQAAELKSLEQRYSYVTGWQVGQNLKRQGSTLDADAFTQGIKDVLTGNKTPLTMDEMRMVLQEYQKKQTEERARISQLNKDAEKDFMAKNGKKKSVTTLDNGIQYSKIKNGTGAQPAKGASVTVHYEGTLLDGTVFDSSYKRGQPATFKLNQVIKGWQEVVPMMKEGAKWHVVIPAQLAYGSRGQGSTIGPDAALRFDIELVKVH